MSRRPSFPAGKPGRRWLWGTGLGLALFGVAGMLALRCVPLPAGLFTAPTPSVEFLDRHGRPLRALLNPNGWVGPEAKLTQIPVALREATVAAEDKRFWQHPGVDWRASSRALWGLISHRRVVSGGSTITQQLIKLAAPRPRTFRTKLIEAVQALRLEQVWTKDQILAAYLNRLDYGNLYLGCAAAAAGYFNKPIGDLSLAEAALLAGLPQTPSRLNPYVHFDRAKKRQTWVLDRLHANGILTAADRDHAQAERLRLRPPGRVFLAPHFVDLLRQLEPGVARTDPGQPIWTSLDLDLNREVERCLRSQLARLSSHHIQNGAVVVLENRTGEVLALVGSEDYFAPASGQVNGAWALRSPGSALKPFTYLLAFEQGATPASVVADVPVEFPTPTGVFAPANYHRYCSGPLRYRLALANSLNIPAVKVLAALGGPSVLQDRLQTCGLTTLTQTAEYYGLGLTLGNAEVRLLELANAYACLARLGEYQPFRLTRGSPIKPSRSICPPGPAYLIADILSDNGARALAFGLQSSLWFEFPVACKTGTSTGYRDNWAFGYTPEFTVGVWAGNFDGSAMENISGVTGAAPLLRSVFELLHERFGTTWYDRPDGVVERRVHAITGKAWSPALRSDPAAPGFVRELFLTNALPPPETPEDYDSRGRVRLGPEYRQWFASGDNALANAAVLDDRSLVDAPAVRIALRVLSPVSGTVVYLDPDLPDGGRKLRLQAEGPAEVVWRCHTLECRRERGEFFVRLGLGRHELTVSDPTTGAQATTWISVKSL